MLIQTEFLEIFTNKAVSNRSNSSVDSYTPVYNVCDHVHLYRQVDAGVVRVWNCRLGCSSGNSGLQTYTERKRGAAQKTTATMKRSYIYEALLFNYGYSWRKKRKGGERTPLSRSCWCLPAA